MKEKIYLVVILICGLGLAGTEGAVLNEAIGFKQGCIQTMACIAVGLFFSYLVYLEETRAARKMR